MSRFKICFVLDESGDYKPIPYSKLMDGDKRNAEFADRYFIPLQGYLLEVSHDDYLAHYKEARRKRYLYSESKRVEEESLDALVFYAGDIIRDACEDVADHVAKKMMAESLGKAITSLSEDEQKLISLYYFDEQTERQCAEVMGVKQATINRRKKVIKDKLKNILLN